MNRTMQRTLSFILCLLMLLTIAPLRFQSAAAEKQLVAGDVNLDGKVGSDDARLALRASVKLEGLTVGQFKCADADQDKKVSSADARLILRASVKLEKLKAVAPVKYYNKTIAKEDQKKYESKDYAIQFLVNFSTDVADHVILDDFYDVEFDAGMDFSETNVQYYMGVGFNEDNEPFFYFPDPDKMKEGKFSFKVLHFSPFGIAKLSDEKLLDVWCERAATQGVMRNISEEEITPGLREIVDQAMEKAGMGKNQYGGAIVRYILSHDTRGEIINAIADGDEKALKAKLANYTGEFIFGKIFTGDDDKVLFQSLGDHAESVKKGMKNGNYGEALKEIVKNVELNMFPYANYVNKFAGLTVKLADIWANDTVNEEYANFLKLGGKRISQDDWNTIVIRMRGASHWLSQKGIKDSDIREMFNKRFDNDEKVKKETEKMKALVGKWKDLNLLSTQYWGRSNGFSDTPPLVERLNSLRRIRESMREMLTINGKLKRGNGYKNLTDEDFLLDCVFYWVTYGPKNRDLFYEWLRKQGIYFDPTGEARDYAWVLVETQVNRVDVIRFTDPGDYILSYDSKPGKHIKRISADNGANSDYVSFIATCTAPPEIIRPGDSVWLDLSAKLSGYQGKDIDFSVTADVRRDQPGLDPYGSAGSGSVSFASKDKKTSVKAEAPSRNVAKPVKSQSLEVYHTFGGPEKENPVTTNDGGQRIAIYFTGCGAQTVWIYEWTPIA